MFANMKNNCSRTGNLVKMKLVIGYTKEFMERASRDVINSNELKI
jgi:hypothetical protein